MLTVTPQGLFCAAGGFHIDPWKGVEHALITHAHSDHARGGSRRYLCAQPGAPLLQSRLGYADRIQTLPYREPLRIGDVQVSFHPAGHVLGSAQIRIEHRGEVWVVSGDYKLQADPTCEAFEPVRCHTFITESTFGLPIYRWPEPRDVFAEMNRWWAANQAEKRTSVLFAYSLGKAQRLLAGVDPSLGPLFVHPAVRELMPAYDRAGVNLPPVKKAGFENIRAAEGRGLAIIPPPMDGGDWLDSLGEVSTAFASGWMLLRGAKGRRPGDRGFVLSDHADWPGLLQAIRATEATRILVTHGYTAPMVRWLNENGWKAEVLPSRFEAASPIPVEPRVMDEPPDS